MITQDQRLEMQITQHQMLYLKLLQMNCMDLESYIREQALSNPLIDPIEEDHSSLPLTDDANINLDYSDDDGWNSGNGSDSYEFTGQDPFALTLERHLLDQLLFLKVSEKEKSLLVFLIQNLDSDGYLRMSAEQVAKLLSCHIQEAEVAISLLQDMDPAGVGAFDLKECLLLQLKHTGCGKKYAKDLAAKIIAEHLESIAKKRYKKIADSLFVSVETVVEAEAIISSLDPKPGARFIATTPIRYVVPDLKLSIINNMITLESRYDSRAPFSIDSYYLNLLKTTDDPETKKWLSNRFSQAKDLLNGIREREQTLQRIVKLLIQRQEDYLINGGKKKVFTMTEAAELLALNVSTVSRAVQDKYIECPNGLIPIRKLFESRANTGEFTYSPDQIKEHIKMIITQENKSQPLSDQKIAEELEKSGISFSRRGVAKYRSEMQIQSASERRLSDS